MSESLYLYCDQLFTCTEMDPRTKKWRHFARKSESIGDDGMIPLLMRNCSCHRSMPWVCKDSDDINKASFPHRLLQI